MSNIYICFSLKSIPNCMVSNDVLEKDYQTVYKQLIKFLYSHPDFCFSFSFSGNQLVYYKKRKNEIYTILKELIERKQVEIFGGGYYEPILPLLYPVDRNGQIDLLSAEIRQDVGKRPRGITLYADCWDSSLVNSLQSSGIEYVVLDSNLIRSDNKKFLPLVVSEMGKSLEVLPYYDEFNPSSEVSPKDFVNNIIKVVKSVEKKDKYVQLQPDRIININIDHKLMSELIDSKWFESLSKYLLQNLDLNVKTTIPSSFRKHNIIKIPCYISSGINKNISDWCDSYYQESDKKVKRINNIFDFMHTYKNIHKLYNRMVYLSMLVNQYKNDKMRKKDAREKLWQAQSGVGLITTSSGILTNSINRQQSYKNFIEVEKILRDDGNFVETINSFDYDGDGLNEYVCRMQNYFAYISLVSGSVNELDILKNPGNYADNLYRVDKFDGFSDDYNRGLFVDFIFSSEQYEKYISNEPSGNGVFSKIHYTELKFSPNRHEITLEANAVFIPTKQKIYLKKKYIVNSDGMNVQYILRNDSNSKLKAKFAVECNFSNITFNPDDIEYFNVEVIDKGKRSLISPEKSTKKLNKQNSLKGVEAVRMTDVSNGTSFGFEPNENCSFFYSPLIFQRPDIETGEKIKTDMTSIVSLIWDVDIEEGKETEKNINFVISTVKKSKK